MPASHAFIHGQKVDFGLLTLLELEGRPQAEIEEIYLYQKALGLPSTLVEVDAASDDQLPRVNLLVTPQVTT
jgi:glycerol dehydrogenase